MARIEGTLGADILVGTDDDDLILGLAGDDRLTGLAGADRLLGGPGDDLLAPGPGDDEVRAGLGDDRLSYAGAPAGVVVDLADGRAEDGAGGNDILVGGFAAIDGSRFGDRLSGTDAAEQLRGSAGNDRLAGEGGDDLLSGGAGNDTADYQSAPAGVQVDLATGEADDGAGGSDRLRGIEAVQGSAFDDTIAGAEADFERFQLLAGNDRLDGRGGTDRVEYTLSPAAVVVDLETGSAEDGFGTRDVLTGVEEIEGSAFADRLVGDSVNNSFRPGAGDDDVDGGDGRDRIDYRDAPAGVRIDLQAGSAADGSGGTDRLVSIERVEGSAFDDVLIGADGNLETERFEGGAGDDVIDGGAPAAEDGSGFDEVSYDDAPAGVRVDLAAGTADDGQGGRDSLANLERVVGSAFDDVLIGGNPAADRLEIFRPLAGDDRVVGGRGVDQVDFASAPGGVVVNLATGRASDGEGGTDTLVGIEQVQGSEQGDRLLGDRAGNRLIGLGRADEIDGRGGPDELRGNGGNDVLRGSKGFDRLEGDDGNDLLRGGPGEDRLEGDAGNDSLFGGTRADELRGGEGNDRLLGAGGVDDLRGNDGDDILRGGRADDRLDGGGGDDWLRGGDGEDLLTGGEGADRLNGGDGSDTLVGGGGADRFVLAALDGSIDGITDFSGDDVLDLSALLGGLAPDEDPADRVQLLAAGNNTLVEVDADGSGQTAVVAVLDGVGGLSLGDLLANGQLALTSADA